VKSLRCFISLIFPNSSMSSSFEKFTSPLSLKS